MRGVCGCVTMTLMIDDSKEICNGFDDFNEMTIVTIVTTVMTTKVTRNLATSFRSEWVEWRRADPAAFKWSQSH